MKFPSVCQDCGNRCVGCHSTCPKYNEAKAEYDAEKAMIRECKVDAWAWEKFKKECINRCKKLRDGGGGRG